VRVQTFPINVLFRDMQLSCPVLDSKSPFTHPSAVPSSGVGLLCNLIIRTGGPSMPDIPRFIPWIRRQVRPEHAVILNTPCPCASELWGDLSDSAPSVLEGISATPIWLGN
jgi:hypothetical protein